MNGHWGSLFVVTAPLCVMGLDAACAGPVPAFAAMFLRGPVWRVEMGGVG